MKEKLTIIQNFILNDVKFKHLESNLGLKSTANVIGDCDFIINYKGDDIDKVITLYKSHIKNITCYNWKQTNTFNWAFTTLKLLDEVKTPYVFYLTEDRLFHNTNKIEFSEVIDEVVKNDIGWMGITKLWKYSNTIHPDRAKRYGKPPYMDTNKHIYTYYAKNSPYKCLSIDSIFRVDILRESLNRLLQNPTHLELSNKYRPHMSEIENKIWFSNELPDMMCAVPKRSIIVSDDDPGYIKIK